FAMCCTRTPPGFTRFPRHLERRTSFTLRSRLSGQADSEQPADGNPDCSRRNGGDSRRPPRGVASGPPQAWDRKYNPMAGGGGFEPPLTGSEPVVLPLDDPPAPILPNQHTHYRNAVEHRQITRRASAVPRERARALKRTAAPTSQRV